MPDLEAVVRVVRRVVLFAIAISVLSACAGVGTGSDGGPKGNVETRASNNAVSMEPSTPQTHAEAMVDFMMPDFRGMNLQDAQNKVQELGIFYSRSHDLRGSRLQVSDSNWQVCTQEPSMGTQIKGKAADYEGKIDFGVVKLTETCP
jgi:hypothetical protein